MTPEPNITDLTNEQISNLLKEILPQSKFGFPTVAFKSAALDAGFQQGALVSKAGTADLCYRAEFKSWRTELTINFNGHAISAEQIVNLLNLGGFSNGVGDWRPAKNGRFGTYHVES